MKDHATHIRLIRDENGKPVEAQYVNPFELYHWVQWRDFDNWATANRIPVTGDWPTNRDVYEVGEVEPVYICHRKGCDGECGTEVIFGCDNKTLHFRLKAKQEITTIYESDGAVDIVETAYAMKAKQEQPIEDNNWLCGDDYRFDGEEPIQSTNDKLKLLSTVQYDAMGYSMVGLFHSGDSGIPDNHNKWFVYFRNAEDSRLKDIMNTYFSEPADCIDNAIEKLTEYGYLKR